MWHTADGLRVLTSQEWKVFATGLQCLVGMIDDQMELGDEEEITETRLFETLSHEQKLCTLALVAEGMHDESVPAIKRYAYFDAAVFAVYEILKGLLQDEITLNECTDIRNAVWNAVEEDVLEEMEVESQESIDEEDWLILLECNRCAVMWDEDFDMDFITDLPAEQAEELKSRFNIDTDYFTGVPPMPNKSDVRQAIAILNRLIDSK